MFHVTQGVPSSVVEFEIGWIVLRLLLVDPAVSTIVQQSCGTSDPTAGVDRTHVPPDPIERFTSSSPIPFLTRMSRAWAALKPGGWFVAEEMDFAAMFAEPGAESDKRRLFDKLIDGHHRVTRRSAAHRSSRVTPTFGRCSAGN